MVFNFNLPIINSILNFLIYIKYYLLLKSNFMNIFFNSNIIYIIMKNNFIYAHII